MTRGERSQVEYTITWESERSGNASSRIVFRVTKAKIETPATPSSTRKRFLAENSISLAIMGGPCELQRPLEQQCLWWVPRRRAIATRNRAENWLSRQPARRR